MNLENILHQPEGKTLEFKRDLSSLKPILKTIVAFANTSGGTLIVGKEPDGKIVGIDDVFEAEEKLANAIADNIYPTVLPEIEIVSHNDKKLIIVHIAHWRGPFYLKQEGQERGVYIRLGSTSRPAEGQILDELRRSLTKISYDQQPLPEVNEEKLNEELIKKLFAGREKVIDRFKLESLGILASYQNKLVCTIGGVILFGKSDARSLYCSEARVSCARFKGTDKVHFIDQFEPEGTIIEILDDIERFIQRNTRLAAEIISMYRRNISEYPSEAIREALVNALVHADYSLTGTHTRVAIYSNRLEIENPGMLPFGYTWEDFKNGKSKIRNRVIVRVFHELNLMEEWGSGYKRIFEVCQKQGYPLPKWEEIGTMVRVTFYPHSATQEGFKEGTFELTPRQNEILSLFDSSDELSFHEIKTLLKRKISDRMLRYDLSKLKMERYLMVEGKGPSTIWKRV